jgi:hypothetical protein
MRATMAAKLGAGLVAMGLLVGLGAAVGHWGIGKLSDTLGFVIGPVWDTAGGAMEGVIGVQREVTAVQRRLLSGVAAAAEEMLSQGEEVTDTAFARMRAGGLLSQGDLAQRSMPRCRASNPCPGP